MSASSARRSDAGIYGNWSNQRIHALSNNQIDIEIDGKSIRKVKEAKSLGLFIDEHLSWTKHIEEISKKISSAIGALKRIRPFISESTALQIYQELILPHFDYCRPVWDELSVTLSDKLQKLQNRPGCQGHYQVELRH